MLDMTLNPDLGLRLLAARTARLTARDRPRPPVVSKRRASGDGAVTLAGNSSLRKRMRAVRRGLFTPPVPSKAAMRRHAWRRRIEAAARLRIAFGQEWPGDREMIA